jgi:hypothetical protein
VIWWALGLVLFFLGLFVLAWALLDTAHRADDQPTRLKKDDR